MMNAALKLCTMVDNNTDIQVMAFRGSDPLESGEESYTYIVYEHKTNRIKRVTFDQFLSGLKPVKK